MRKVSLPRWCAMTVLPLDTVSSRGYLVQAPAGDSIFYSRLPLPLWYRIPQDTEQTLAGIIDDVYLDGRELRAAGKLDHDTVAGRHLALRLLGREQIPVAAKLHTPAFDFEMSLMLQHETRENVRRYVNWMLVAVIADPPGGAIWDTARMWKV